MLKSQAILSYSESIRKYPQILKCLQFQGKCSISESYFQNIDGKGSD